MTIILFLDGDGLLVNEDFRTVESWCDAEGDTFLVGDVNGDDHDDWICHHSDGPVCVKYNSLIFGGKFIVNLPFLNKNSNIYNTL